MKKRIKKKNSNEKRIVKKHNNNKDFEGMVVFEGVFVGA